MLIYMLNTLNYANYALCSDCVIMPKSNAGIIGLAQAASIIAHKHVPMLGQNRQRSPRFVTAHATTVTRWGHVRQLLCVECRSIEVKPL